MPERPTARLRALISKPGCVVAPGVADALAARLVALEGFDAVYMTGFGTSLTRLGAPDVGLLTATEMVDNAMRIVDASGLPVIADADTGYGNPSTCAARFAITSAQGSPACTSKTRRGPSAAATSRASA